MICLGALKPPFFCLDQTFYLTNFFRLGNPMPNFRIARKFYGVVGEVVAGGVEGKCFLLF